MRIITLYKRLFTQKKNNVTALKLHQNKEKTWLDIIFWFYLILLFYILSLLILGIMGLMHKLENVFNALLFYFKGQQQTTILEKSYI